MFLLDTHVLLWWLSEPEKLTASEYAAIEDKSHFCHLSAASIWEIAIKVSLNKLTLPKGGLLKPIKDNDFEIIPIDAEIALSVKDLPYHHTDPFDRLIIATAQRYRLTVLTHDLQFQKYPVDLFHCQ